MNNDVEIIFKDAPADRYTPGEFYEDRSGDVFVGIAGGGLVPVHGPGNYLYHHKSRELCVWGLGSRDYMPLAHTRRGDS